MVKYPGNFIWKTIWNYIFLVYECNSAQTAHGTRETLIWDECHFWPSRKVHWLLRRFESASIHLLLQRTVQDQYNLLQAIVQAPTLGTLISVFSRMSNLHIWINILLFSLVVVRLFVAGLLSHPKHYYWSSSRTWVYEEKRINGLTLNGSSGDVALHNSSMKQQNGPNPCPRCRMIQVVTVLRQVLPLLQY